MVLSSGVTLVILLTIIEAMAFRTSETEGAILSTRGGSVRGERVCWSCSSLALRKTPIE